MSENCDSKACNDNQPEPRQTIFGKYKEWFPSIISFMILIAGIIFDQTDATFFKNYIRLAWFGVAFITIGGPVLMKALRKISEGKIFTEYFLMSLATLGAFAIGEYPEGVAVMLFYAVGELFQDAAVNRAKRSIQALLDVRPDTVSVVRN